VNIEDTQEWTAYERTKLESIKSAAYLARWTHEGHLQLGESPGALMLDHARASAATERCLESVRRKRLELAPQAPDADALVIEAHTQALIRYTKTNDATLAAIQTMLARLAALEEANPHAGFNIVLGVKP